MNYRAIFKTLFIGFIVFALAVALGIKFDWGRYLDSDSAHGGQDNTTEHSGLPAASSETTKSAAPQQDTSLKDKIKGFEILDEKNVNQSADELIRNDCIRASRRAGVTDEHIFEVVNRCVEMSKKEHAVQPEPAEESASGIESVDGTDSTFAQQPSVEESLELTRKACKIVADEEQGLSPEERLKMIEQCVKANSQ